MIRSLNPTDLAVLLLFLGKSPIDGASTRDRFSRKREGILSQIPIVTSCLIPQEGRHILGYSRHGLIQGLVGLRRRSGPGKWEIERLLLTDHYEEYGMDLLERLGTAWKDIGLERLFLRLDSTSPLVDMARQAGFGHYKSEYLFLLEDRTPATVQTDKLGLIQRVKEDDYALFKLYNTVVPPKVRSAEGMTFQEWVESKEKAAWKEYVVRKEGDISVWLKLRSDKLAGQFEILAQSQLSDLSMLVDFCIAELRERHLIYCLVSDYQDQLHYMVSEKGFTQVAEYYCFSKQFTQRIREPKLVPMQV